MPIPRLELEPATLHYLWRNEYPQRRFRTAVSLHSHTLHSRELLDFIPRLGEQNALVRKALHVYEKRYRAKWGKPVPYNRAWWTPPVCAKQALDLERRQIQEQLALSALVSITDHDDIDAARRLSVTSDARAVIWSVEWTVPFRGTAFHIGVHNMPAVDVEARFKAMREFTANPVESLIPELLEWLGSTPGSMIVFNHPLWDETGVGADAHNQTLMVFMQSYVQYMHALEMNGLRPWKENMQVIELARSAGKVAVSGGDRHGTEPNAILDLTNAAYFSEFAEDVRNGRPSEILFMPQYRQNRTLRLLHNVLDIVGDQQAHSHGWTAICDRVFHLCEDGQSRSLTQILKGRQPRLAMALTAVTRIARQQPVRSALRLAMGAEEVV